MKLPTDTVTITANSIVEVQAQAGQLDAEQELLDEWAESRGEVTSQSQRQFADAIVELCRRRGVLDSDPPGAICVMEDGSVMFDWNDGTLPMLTIVVTPKPSFAYAGRFISGKCRGEDEASLEVLDAALMRFVRERGTRVCQVNATLGSWLNVERRSPAEGLFSIHPEHPNVDPPNFRFTPQTVQVA